MAGNWKMYKTPADTASFFEKFLPLVAASRHCEVLICPPFVNIAAAVEAARGSNVAVGGQNLYWSTKEGAFTGEVSGPMLKAAGCSSAIVGHSERRQAHGETDADVRAKAEAASAAGLRVILCIGESLDVREADDAVATVSAQLDASLPTAPVDAIAYEPIWAIGTGKIPSIDDIGSMHAALRQRLVAAYGKDGNNVRILYGGSVKASNAAEIFAIADVDGALVGGASLKAADFLPIVHAAH